jgi:nicotinic acid mononucleotide adenylyltransferase
MADLIEQKERLVFTFGRFNPPTTGHELLLNTVKKIANGDDYKIFVSNSHTKDPEKNPLPSDIKIEFMKEMFPEHAEHIIYTPKLNTIFQIVATVQVEYKDICMVVGSDRVEEFKPLLLKYNGKDYTFRNIEVVSAGERDPDAEGTIGMSASKMREAVLKSDMKTFESGIPKCVRKNLEFKSKLFGAVFHGMSKKK